MKSNTLRKFLALTLSGVLALTCAACGADNTESEQSFVSAESQQMTEPKESNDNSDSSESSKTDVSSNTVDYQSVLDKVVNQYNFTGVVYISKDGDMLCEKAEGSKEPSSIRLDSEQENISMDTLFCIGSVSKQFTAASIMLLKEEGKLSVDDTLDKYFPQYEIGRDITIKDLLTMRSGIVDYYAVENDDGTRSKIEDDEENGSRYEVFSAADGYINRQAIEEWIFNQPLNFEPNTDYEYSNSNYMLLAEIVELVSEKDYHIFVKEEIFDPLGMEYSGFIDDLYDSTELAKGSEELTDESYPGVTTGAGDIISCAADMDRWLTAFRENTLLSKESYKEMTTDYSGAAEGMGYGYGVMLSSDGGIVHAGSISTYLTIAYTNPKKAYNLFAVTNNADELFGDISSFGTRLIEETMK